MTKHVLVSKLKYFKILATSHHQAKNRTKSYVG